MGGQTIYIVIAICVFGLVGVSTVQGGDMLTTGTVAPDFTVKTFDGADLTLSKVLEEGPVVLVFIRGFG